MNQEQVMGLIRGAGFLFAGWALSHGISEESWTAIIGGLAAAVSTAWSIYSNTIKKQIDNVAASPEVAKVVASPAIVASTNSPKVTAR